MKKGKLFKLASPLLALALVLSLMIVALPAAPASAQTTTDYQDAIEKAGDRLVLTQNTDGGFDWTYDSDPAKGSATNCLGITAMGILKAWELEDKADYETALAKAYWYVVVNPPVWTEVDGKWKEDYPPGGVNSWPDITFLVKLANAAAGDATLLSAIGTASSDIADLARARWDDRLNHLGDDPPYLVGTATAMAVYLRDARHGQGYDALIPWDLEAAVKAALALDAYYPGQGYAQQANDIAGVMDACIDDTGDLYFSSTDASQEAYVLGLTGAIEGFTELGLYSAKVTELKTQLISIQQPAGYWDYYGAEPGTMSVQDTAYAVMALFAQGGDDAREAATQGSSWLVSVQKGDGGWYPEDNSGVENLEVDSEAAWALTYGPWCADGTTTLSGDPPASIEITAPSGISGWALTPGVTNTKTGTLNVKCNTDWEVKATDEDLNTDGRMTQWTGSAYVPAKKLAHAMEVSAASPVTLPTGGVIDAGTEADALAAGDIGENITVTFKQTVSYGDAILGSPDCYRIVVTFTGTTTV